jgi:uncharacterized protein HemX
MENVVNNPNPAPAPSNSSGANTVLIVVIIIILLGFGYWWYRHGRVAPSNTTINVTTPAPITSGTAQ